MGGMLYSWHNIRFLETNDDIKNSKKHAHFLLKDIIRTP